MHSQPRSHAYAWRRPVEQEKWDPVPKAEADRHVLNAEDVGCWIFAEWKYVDGKGEALAEGATEASDTAVRQSAA